MPAKKPSHAAPRRAAPPRTRTLRIESIAAGGAGVARDEGRAVFVPRTAPGDLVEASIEARGSTLQARVLRVIEPGPDRVAPACPFVGECGGCDLMHLSASAQHAAHRAIVEEALHRTGGFATLPAITTHVVPRGPSSGPPSADPASFAPEGDSAAALAYRTRARFFARSKRGKISVGYRAEGSHDLVSIPHCAVLVPALDALLVDLPDVLDRALGDGEISVALGDGERPVVDIAWRGEVPPEVWSRIDARTAAAGGQRPDAPAAAGGQRSDAPRIQGGTWAGARLWLEGASTPASFGDPRPMIRGADGARLLIAAGGFAQPSDEAASLIATRARALAQKSGDKLGSLVELYAGSGTLSILLAPLASRFVAVESQEEAVRCARENLSVRKLEGKVTCADAATFDPGRADVVVLDPPRTGARGAIERIAASGSRAVVYVACDPTTMARDLAVLAAAGFALTDLETIEAFPQTSHIETLARLVRGKR